MAGVGAMSVDWVTNPQDDDMLMLTSRSESYCDRLTDLQLNSTVLYGTNSTSLVSTGQGEYSCYTADEYQSGALHHVILGLGPEGPLKASTQYFYQVGDPQLALSELYSFTTPPEAGANSLPYRLGLIGDLGQTENSMDTLDHAAALEPVSVLNVGDLSYADGYQPRWDSYGRLVQSSAARIPWQVIEGNHEEEVVEGKLGFLAYEKRFHTPSTFSESNTNLYYSYEVAGLHVIMLGCYADYSRKSQQGQLNELGPMYINIGDGGNREGLSSEYIKPSPRWSSFREPSYGMGVLNVMNTTHAVWQWHRNQDGIMVIGDEIDIIRTGQNQIPVAGMMPSFKAYFLGAFRRIYKFLQRLLQPPAPLKFA
ncbi:hypothetical protein WJX79_006674 [Trebouxia sp. C0005]